MKEEKCICEEVGEGDLHEHGERNERKEEGEPSGQWGRFSYFLTDYLFLFTVFVQCLTKRVSLFVLNINFTL